MKVGDVVRCDDASGHSGKTLRLGRHYEVASDIDHNGLVWIKNDLNKCGRQYVYAHRFAATEPSLTAAIVGDWVRPADEPRTIYFEPERGLVATIEAGEVSRAIDAIHASRRRLPIDWPGECK